MPENNEKRVIDWNAIRAEYIAGGIGQRKLAKKHGVPAGTLLDKARTEQWAKLREKAQNQSMMKSVQKTAEAVASNAITAQRIRAKLLARLEKEIDALPETIGTQKRQSLTDYTYSLNGKQIKSQKDLETQFRLRDLTAAWKDLTEGLIIAEKPEGTPDDGFLAALSGTAAEDWGGGDDAEEATDDGDEE